MRMALVRQLDDPCGVTWNRGPIKHEGGRLWRGTQREWGRTAEDAELPHQVSENTLTTSKWRNNRDAYRLHHPTHARE